MSYMNQDKKKALAPQIKAVLAKYGVKGTIAVRHHSSLVVNLKEGVLDFIGQANADNKAAAEWRGQEPHVIKDNYQANPYFAHESGDEKIASFFSELVDAMNGKGSSIANHNNSDVQSDYFDVGWYLSINVGDWDKPYIFKK